MSIRTLTRIQAMTFLLFVNKGILFSPRGQKARDDLPIEDRSMQDIRDLDKHLHLLQITNLLKEHIP